LKTTAIALAVLMTPCALYAQASIAGLVRDQSGAVLPGVRVEASSDALIERVRAAASGATGQYRIVDLRPGLYTVTFTLNGFASIRRVAIELTGAFTATVNVDMKVGSVEETITVTTATPIVDVQSARRQTTIPGDIVNALPTSKGYAGLMMLMPGIITNTGVDVQVTPAMVIFGGAGGRGNEGRLQLDGLSIGASIGGSGVSSYNADLTNSQEVVTTISGGFGEAEVGGPTISIVPKVGGDTLKGTGYVAGSGRSLVGSNYTDALRAAGLASPQTILKLWDYHAGAGGPIRKSRVWFFAAYRDEGSHLTIPGLFANKNFNAIAPNAPNASVPWTYVADTTKPARNANSWTMGSLRLTVQATRRNKISLFWDEQHPCNGSTWTPQGNGCRQPTGTEVYGFSLMPAGVSPEAAGYSHRFQRVQQATWTSPLSGRVLLEAGMGTMLARWGVNRRPDSVTQDLVRVIEGCAQGCAANGGIPNLVYRSERAGDDWGGAHTWRASASFLSGAHNLKIGYQGAFHVDDQQNFPNSTSTFYTVQNGTASGSGASITETLEPFQIRQRVRYDAFYGQERWTVGSLTVQGALRYDHAWSYFPDQQVGPVRFLTTPVVFAQDDPAFSTPSLANCGTVPAGFTATCVNNVTGYHDVTPRIGAAYDPFGTGKTSVRVLLGKYLEAASSNGNYVAGNPTARLTTSVTRTWIDANRNFVPDCVLENPLMQGSLSPGGDLCGQIGNLNFGKAVFSNSFDSRLMGGWGVRPSDWGVSASIQQQILPQTSVEVGYTRRWLQNFTVTDNLLQSVGDLTPFSIVAPADARLPRGGGYVVSGLFNPVQSVASLANSFNTLAGNYGDQYQYSNAVLVDASSRLGRRLTLKGSLSAWDTVQDNCEVRAKIPELVVPGSAIGVVTPAGPPVGPTVPYCHIATGLIWRATGLGVYLIPKIDVQVSGTLRSDQGVPLAANYNVPTATVATQGPQPLGRPLSNGASFAVVNLIAPGTMYGDRVNEIDFKIARIVKVARTRVNAGAEIYNALNSSAILAYNPTFLLGGTWRPTAILTARFVKLTAQIDF
jgi:hypothetical protein